MLSTTDLIRSMHGESPSAVWLVLDLACVGLAVANHPLLVLGGVQILGYEIAHWSLPLLPHGKNYSISAIPVNIAINIVA